MLMPKDQDWGIKSADWQQIKVQTSYIYPKEVTHWMCWKMKLEKKLLRIGMLSTSRHFVLLMYDKKNLNGSKYKKELKWKKISK